MPPSMKARGLCPAPFHSPVRKPQAFEITMMKDMKSGQPSMGPIEAIRAEAAPLRAMLPIQSNHKIAPKSELTAVPESAKRGRYHSCAIDAYSTPGKAPVRQ